LFGWLVFDRIAAAGWNIHGQGRCCHQKPDSLHFVALITTLNAAINHGSYISKNSPALEAGTGLHHRQLYRIGWQCQ